MSFKITGLNELQKELKQMKKATKELEQTKQVSFDNLFTTSFMQKYTSFSSIDEFLNAGGFTAQTQEDFEAIPEKELDKYISNTTNFKNWEDMLGEATEQYVLKKLGF